MGFIRLAQFKDVKEGKLLSINTVYGRVALTCKNEKLLAFEDRCSHDDGVLSDGTIVDGVVECKRHGARFDMRTGKCLRMPATEDIDIYKTRLIDGWIEVDLS